MSSTRVPDAFFRSGDHYYRRVPGLACVVTLRPDASIVVRFDNGEERPASLVEITMWHRLCDLTDTGDGAYA